MTDVKVEISVDERIRSLGDEVIVLRGRVADLERRYLDMQSVMGSLQQGHFDLEKRVNKSSRD